MSAPTAASPQLPLRHCYWVVPGLLLAGEHPGGPTREKTKDRLKKLLAAGIECFVDLTKPTELLRYDTHLPFYVEYTRKAIKDHGVPGSRDQMVEILDYVGNAMRAGRPVYVHCRAGIGRTGTVIGCLLVERGLSGDGALDELNRLWQQSKRSKSWAFVPETEAQANYIREWKPSLKNGGLELNSLASAVSTVGPMFAGQDPRPGVLTVADVQSRAASQATGAGQARAAMQNLAAGKGRTGEKTAGANYVAGAGLAAAAAQARAAVQREESASPGAGAGSANGGGRSAVAAKARAAADRDKASRETRAADGSIATGRNGAGLGAARVGPAGASAPRDPAAGALAAGAGAGSASAGGAPAGGAGAGGASARGASAGGAGAGGVSARGASAGGAGASGASARGASAAGASAGTLAAGVPPGGTAAGDTSSGGNLAAGELVAGAVPHTSAAAPPGGGSLTGAGQAPAPSHAFRVRQAPPAIPVSGAALDGTAAGPGSPIIPPPAIVPPSGVVPASGVGPGSAFGRAPGVGPGPAVGAGPAGVGPDSRVGPGSRVGAGPGVGPDSRVGASPRVGAGSGVGPDSRVGASPRVGAGSAVGPGPGVGPALGADPAAEVAPAPGFVPPPAQAQADSDPLLDTATLVAARALRERFVGTLFGLAVGDAVAAATQFRRAGSFSPVGDMIGGGPFDLPRGAWSDDTAMALCLAESLLECNGFDPRDQVQRYGRWQQEGYLSCTGQCVGITANTARSLALAKWRRVVFPGSFDPEQLDPEPLSRIAPIALYYLASLETTLQQAADSARTTCQAPAVLDACRQLGRSLNAALSGQPKARIVAGVTPITEGAAHMNNTAAAALAAAFWAFSSTDNFRDAVLRAANVGGNSDVVTSVCGQLAGAHYGMSAIPPSWRNGLMQKDLIEGYADRLLAHGLVSLSS